MLPHPVITAAAASAHRVSASAPPGRLIGAASLDGGQCTTRSQNQGLNDRPWGRQLEAAAGGAPGGGYRKGGGVHSRNWACVYYSAIHRELSQPPSLLSPQNASHIALGSHLRPPFFGVPTALCQTPGEKKAYIKPFVSL